MGSFTHLCENDQRRSWVGGSKLRCPCRDGLAEMAWPRWLGLDVLAEMVYDAMAGSRWFGLDGWSTTGWPRWLGWLAHDCLAEMAYDAIAGPTRWLGHDGLAEMAGPRRLGRDGWAPMAVPRWLGHYNEMAGPRWLGRDGLRRYGWAIMTRWLGRHSLSEMAGPWWPGHDGWNMMAWPSQQKWHCPEMLWLTFLLPCGLLPGCAWFSLSTTSDWHLYCAEISHSPATAFYSPHCTDDMMNLG